MPDPKAATNEAVEEAGSADALSSEALDLDGLKARGDVEGLLTLARAYRSGAAPGGRDMKRCLDAYRAAAELGSADAEYAVALFCMTGGIVSQDLKEGATRLRAAAEKGSVPAKVYLGNLYELGINYKADPEKADVWYRNAARGAGVKSDPGSGEYSMDLAELGCVRYVLALVESGKVEGDEKTRLLQRARAHGYGLKLKDADLGSTDRPTFLDALSNADGSTTGAGVPPAERQRANTAPETKQAKDAAQSPPAQVKEASPAPDKAPADKAPADKALPRAEGPTRTSLALAAFGYAMLFALTGLGAGYAATLGAHELVARGHPLPGLGTKTEYVFPIVLGLIGVLPTWLVYRLGTVIKALVIGGAFGGIGWVAWGTGQAAILSQRPIQALTFGLAGFLAGLFVLGLLGGTKKQPPRPKRVSRTP